VCGCSAKQCCAVAWPRGFACPLGAKSTICVAIHPSPLGSYVRGGRRGDAVRRAWRKPPTPPSLSSFTPCSTSPHIHLSDLLGFLGQPLLLLQIGSRAHRRLRRQYNCKWRTTATTAAAAYDAGQPTSLQVCPSPSPVSTLSISCLTSLTSLSHSPTLPVSL
jgi:hypothetical protein